MKRVHKATAKGKTAKAGKKSLQERFNKAGITKAALINFLHSKGYSKPFTTMNALPVKLIEKLLSKNGRTPLGKLIELMDKTHITVEQVQAYTAKEGDFPASEKEIGEMPEDYIQELIRPKNWKKALKTITQVEASKPMGYNEWNGEAYAGDLVACGRMAENCVAMLESHTEPRRLAHIRELLREALNTADKLEEIGRDIAKLIKK